MKKNSYQTKDVWFYVILGLVIILGFLFSEGFRERKILSIIITLVVSSIAWISYRYFISDTTKISKTEDPSRLNNLFNDLFSKQKYSDAYKAIEKMYERGGTMELDIMYLSVVPLIRDYSKSDEDLLSSMTTEFYTMDKATKMKYALIPYIRGYYYHKIGNIEMAKDYKSETYEAEPYFDSKYPQYINNLKY